MKKPISKACYWIFSLSNFEISYSSDYDIYLYWFSHLCCADFNINSPKVAKYIKIRYHLREIFRSILGCLKLEILKIKSLEHLNACYRFICCLFYQTEWFFSLVINCKISKMLFRIPHLDTEVEAEAMRREDEGVELPREGTIVGFC